MRSAVVKGTKAASSPVDAIFTNGGKIKMDEAIDQMVGNRDKFTPSEGVHRRF
jgi:hypothetical protein